MNKIIIENQIVIMSTLRNLCDHFIAENESDVINNIENTKRLREILTERIKNNKKVIE